MDKRIAQNVLNFILSDRFTFQGTDVPPLLEIIRELQAHLSDGAAQDSQSGNTQEPSL